jgi:hypothetical protein
MTIIEQLNDYKRELNRRLYKFLDDTSKLITDLDDSAQEANQRLQDFTNSTTINVTPNLDSTLATRKRPYDMAAKTQTAPMKTPMQSETVPQDLLHGNRRNSKRSDSE